MKVDKLSDLDWSELVEKHNLDMHPDHLRKMAYGVKLVRDNNRLGNGAVEESLLNELRIEKQKLFDLRRGVNEALRLESRSELLRESISSAIQGLPAKPMIDEPIREPIVVGEQTLLVCISDIHYGAEWEAEGIDGSIINKYNPEVFERRMSRALIEIAKIKEFHGINKIQVLLGGDSIDGMLRNSQLTKIRYGIVESTMQYAEFMAEWLAVLSKDCLLKVCSVDGNHSEIRPLGSGRGDFPEENMEKIIMWYLAERLKHKQNIEVDSKASKHKLLTVEDMNVLLIHGDEAGSLPTILRDYVNLYGNKIDLAVVGHKHREQDIASGYGEQGNTYIMRTPSLCGMDNYAKGLRRGGRAGITIVVVEKGIGRKCIYPIEFKESYRG